VERGGALALDDQAWIAIDPPLRRTVLLVTPGADALELALGTPRARELAVVEVARPDVLATEEYQKKASQGFYALAIYDRCSPNAMPQANTLFVGALPPGDLWRKKPPVSVSAHAAARRPPSTAPRTPARGLSFSFAMMGPRPTRRQFPMLHGPLVCARLENS